MPVDASSSPPAGLDKVLEENIRTLVERRERDERQAPWSDRVAGRVTRFTGSMVFVLLHLVLVGGWFAVNLGLVPGVAPVDPSFVVLAMLASVEAIFLTSFVLISQNRMARTAEKRADLDLQINLLAEHEITRLVSLTRAIAERLDVEVPTRDLAEAERDVAPGRVLDAIESRQEADTASL
jgi:uncharacterized membrane protein